MSKKAVFGITALFPLTISVSAFFLQETPVVYEDSETRETCCSLPPNVRKMMKFLSQKMIILPILFVFFFAMTPSTSGAMFYFYTNELKFSPNFLGQLKLVFATASLIGILAFNKFLKDVKFVKIFFWSTLFTFATGLSQLLLITRKNVDLGIPDKVFALFDSIIITVISEINIMPILVLACRLCPKNIEGTMYAFILSVSNFGGLLGMQWGGLMTDGFGVTDKNFSNLAKLVLVSYVITLAPLLVLPCINFDAAQDTAEKHTESHLALSEEEDDESRNLVKNDSNQNIDDSKDHLNTSKISNVALEKKAEMNDNILEHIRDKQFVAK